MSRGDVGRNDPCPCGSGRKYKHCCLRKDQARRRRQREAAPAPYAGTERAAGVREQVNRIRSFLSQHVSGSEAQELEKEAGRIEIMATYAAMEDEIDAAMANLEEHRSECESMMADPGAALERMVELASESRFDALRVSVDELQEAFDGIGYPLVAAQAHTQEGMDILLEAAMHLAGDKSDRLTRARQMLIVLPEYVAAGRYCDAWLLQHSAYRMTMRPEESNPFMFASVVLALEAWREQVQSERGSLFEVTGADAGKLAFGNLEDALASAQALAGDAEVTLRVERFLADHPDLRAMAEEEFLELDRRACALLEREDVERILPSSDEVAPWVEVLMERTLSFRADMQTRLERGEVPDEEIAEAHGVVIEVVREMAEALYTPKRVEALIEDLKAYRETLEAAGEAEAAQKAEAALMVTAASTRPADSAFMTAVCHVGLRETVRALAEEGTDA